MVQWFGGKVHHRKIHVGEVTSYALSPHPSLPPRLSLSLSLSFLLLLFSLRLSLSLQEYYFLQYKAKSNIQAFSGLLDAPVSLHSDSSSRVFPGMKEEERGREGGRKRRREGEREEGGRE